MISFHGVFSGKTSKKLFYIIESADWSIKWDGYYITKYINELTDLKASVRTDLGRIRNSIIHFGSRNLYLPTKFKKIHSSNRTVFTWFHGTPEDTLFIKALPEGCRRADFVHTSCEISRQQLISWGVPEKKIVVIPIGVDLSLFKPKSPEEINKSKRELGIPPEAKVIGSFQKDGNFWGEGKEPKLIKGPDVLCDVLEQLNKVHPIYVILTGPARGYVKDRLISKGVPFKHLFLKDYRKIAEFYPLLDLYIIASRAEGGPKAITEGMACGVPIVSTKVGMAPEVIKNGINGFLVDVNDVETLLHYSKSIIENYSLQNKFIYRNMHLVKKFDYRIIAMNYYDKMYSKLIN